MNTFNEKNHPNLKKYANNHLLHARESKQELYQAILKLKSIAECEAFFQDLCTPAELTAMADRFHVAKLLDAGTHSYRDIHDHTGVSLATIGRVARFLSQEPYQGYRLVIDRIKTENT